MKILWSILIVCAVLLLAWALLLTCRRPNRWRAELNTRYAHRGFHQKPEIPENSLAAFRRAAERGWGAELDIHLMKDGNLAVIHDSSLLRTAGVEVRIEDLTAADLEDYTLEASGEHIPLLEQVLEIFRDKGPLIVELKPVDGNCSALCEAAALRLDAYEGEYCIESFDPRAVLWFRKNRPQVCRGQLAENFFRWDKSGLSWPLRLLGTNLLGNFLTRPDFIAYRFSDRRGWSPCLCRALWRPRQVYWTITNRRDLETVEMRGAVGIFEQFDPEK